MRKNSPWRPLLAACFFGLMIAALWFFDADFSALVDVLAQR